MLETDLKRMLAYSTISALGVLMLLLGIGTPQAVTAGLVYLLAHACYKGALFLVAGAVEHETGTRDVTALGGLRRAMPRTALGAALAAGSMAGLPLFVGFVAKEQLYESVILATLPGLGERCARVSVVAASMCLGAAGLIAGIVARSRRCRADTRGPRRAAGAVAGAARSGRDGRDSWRVPALGAGPIALASAAVTGTRSTAAPRPSGTALPRPCCSAR